MIDSETYWKLHGEKEDHQGECLNLEEMDQDEPPDGHFLQLLPYTIIGFGFHDKKWRKSKTLLLPFISLADDSTSASIVIREVF